MPKSTTYKPTETIDELQHDIVGIHERLRRTTNVSAGYDRVYAREIESAMKKEAKSVNHAKRAAQLLAAGNKKEAVRAERRARLDHESAERIRAKATKRWNERQRRVGQRRTGLLWALTATFAAAAAVAVGSTVMTPEPATGRFEEPKIADVEVGPPPAVEGDTARGEVPADEVVEPEPNPPQDEPAPVDVPADVAADDSTSYIVHALYVGSGGGVAPTVLGGVSYTIVPLDEGRSTLSGSTVASEAPEPSPLRPGSYRVTVDDSGYATLTCKGKYATDFTVEKGKRVIVTAYLKDQATNGGSNSFAGKCIDVRFESVE